MLIVMYDLLTLLLPHLTAILAFYLLYSAVKECLTGKVPPAPAAIGRAAGIILFGQICSIYLLWYVSFVLSKLFGVDLSGQDFAWLHGPIGIAFIALAGYLSVRTYEDTKNMNLKIAAVIGLLMQALVTFFNFYDGLSTVLAFYLFIPAIFIGGYWGTRRSNAHVN